MEFNTTPSYYGNRASERGAGGKFKKPAARKPPATPYDRPQLNQTGGRTGWLSKLVDPAYRIISGSATRILPSFISNAIASTPPPPPPEEIHGDLGMRFCTFIEHVMCNITMLGFLRICLCYGSFFFGNCVIILVN